MADSVGAWEDDLVAEVERLREENGGLIVAANSVRVLLERHRVRYRTMNHLLTVALAELDAALPAVSPSEGSYDHEPC